MKFFSILSGIIVVILGVGYVVTNNSTPTQTATLEAPTDRTTHIASADRVSEATTNTIRENITPITTNVDSTTGLYAPYDAETITQSDADHILLFFKASWCPSCRALDADIIAHAGDIPAGVEIYAVDYDTETALKRRYGITTQHSIIEISADGTAKSGISHGLTLADVLATI